VSKLDPKIAIPVCIVIVILAVVIILRSSGVGKTGAPPPIATGGGPAGTPILAGSANTSSIPGGKPGAPTMTLPGADKAGVAPPMPMMNQVPGGGAAGR